jgi:hypothetical protein
VRERRAFYVYCLTFGVIAIFVGLYRLLGRHSTPDYVEVVAGALMVVVSISALRHPPRDD